MNDSIDSWTALGAHTFFVGFQRGMEQTLGKGRVLGSVEGWVPGIEAREACGAGHIPFSRGKREEAQLVFSNPPCSRYSAMSTGAFTEADKSNIVNFCELTQATEVAAAVGAKALWWETGPLLWGKGEGMVESAHAAMERHWGVPSTTVVLRLDLRYAGVPQRRPRCHVLHARGSLEPPDPPDGGLEPGLKVQEWVHARAPTRLRYAYSPPSPARRTATMLQYFGTFESGKPSIVKHDAPYAPAVISARQFAWDEPDIWWSLEEYAALMCYPQEDAIAVCDKYGPRHAKVMLAKSVSPSAARWAWENVWRATLTTEGRGGIWYVDCSYPDGASVLVRPMREKIEWNM